MPALYDTHGVADIAIKIIEEKGYKISYIEKADIFLAEKENWAFRAEKHSSLLGLVSTKEALTDVNCDDTLNNIRYEEISHLIKDKPKPYKSVIGGKNDKSN